MHRSPNRAPASARRGPSKWCSAPKLRRLEFETKQGKLIEAEVYRKTAANAFRAFRDGLLGLPDRLATVLAAESDPKKVHVTLKTEISRELEAAADAILAL